MAENVTNDEPDYLHAFLALLLHEEELVLMHFDSC